MKIWKIKGNLNGRECYDVEDTNDNMYNLYNFHEKGVVENWPGLKVSFTSGKKYIDKMPINNITEFTDYTFLFICDEQSKEMISKKFSCIQFLPVTPIEKDISEKSNFYLPNVLNIIDVLDENKSQFEYLRNKYLIDIIKYYFNEEVKKYPVFYLKVKNHVFHHLYATDDFKNFVEKCGITGFIFEEVFDFDKIEKEN